MFYITITFLFNLYNQILYIYVQEEMELPNNLIVTQSKKHTKINNFFKRI